MKSRIWIIHLIFGVALILFGVRNSSGFREAAFNFFSYPDPVHRFVQNDSLLLDRRLKESVRRVSALKRRVETFAPAAPYLIINTTRNTFVLRTRTSVLREGMCSTGSYILLDAGEGQQWMFKTPRGQFRILGKIPNPVWRKPDWNFVEEGLPIPPPNHPDRFERGTLGDYALNLGQGYLIHGTLYQRFLGLPVTHGCIRLGDDDLKVVYQTLQVGSRVYIY